MPNEELDKFIKHLVSALRGAPKTPPPVPEPKSASPFKSVRQADTVTAAPIVPAVEERRAPSAAALKDAAETIERVAYPSADDASFRELAPFYGASTPEHPTLDGNQVPEARSRSIFKKAAAPSTQWETFAQAWKEQPDRVRAVSLSEFRQLAMDSLVPKIITPDALEVVVAPTRIDVENENPSFLGEPVMVKYALTYGIEVKDGFRGKVTGMLAPLFDWIDGAEGATEVLVEASKPAIGFTIDAGKATNDALGDTHSVGEALGHGLKEAAVSLNPAEIGVSGASAAVKAGAHIIIAESDHTRAEAAGRDAPETPILRKQILARGSMTMATVHLETWRTLPGMSSQPVTFGKVYVRVEVTPGSTDRLSKGSEPMDVGHGVWRFIDNDFSPGDKVMDHDDPDSWFMLLKTKKLFSIHT